MPTEIPALWAFEEDVLTRSWMDWLEAHTSFLKPLHRYEGLITILPDRLHFSGRDKRTGDEVSWDLHQHEIEQLHMGFDEAFNARETRSLGFAWLPIRLTFLRAGKELKLYLIINYHSGWTSNQEFFDFLKDWLG